VDWRLILLGFCMDVGVSPMELARLQKPNIEILSNRRWWYIVTHSSVSYTCLV
jgi:hypothetical protein